MENEELASQYFSLGTQYYVAGRFAVCAGLIPVAGTLFHYGIEMYLKGVLCRRLSEADLKALRHKLVDIWNAFKAQAPGLERFDELIEKIDSFWQLRYPEAMVREGMLCHFSFEAAGSQALGPPPNQPGYDVIVGDVDTLVATIFEAAHVNPKFFTQAFNHDARTYFNRWRH